MAAGAGEQAGALGTSTKGGGVRDVAGVASDRVAMCLLRSLGDKRKC
jgi:hypothetical protein